MHIYVSHENFHAQAQMPVRGAPTGRGPEKNDAREVWIVEEEHVRRASRSKQLGVRWAGAHQTLELRSGTEVKDPVSSQKQQDIRNDARRLRGHRAGVQPHRAQEQALRSVSNPNKNHQSRVDREHQSL